MTRSMSSGRAGPRHRERRRDVGGAGVVDVLDVRTRRARHRIAREDDVVGAADEPVEAARGVALVVRAGQALGVAERVTALFAALLGGQVDRAVLPRRLG